MAASYWVGLQLGYCSGQSADTAERQVGAPCRERAVVTWPMVQTAGKWGCASNFFSTCLLRCASDKHPIARRCPDVKSGTVCNAPFGEHRERPICREFHFILLVGNIIESIEIISILALLPPSLRMVLCINIHGFSTVVLHKLYS